MLAQRYDVLTALQSMASNPVTDNAFENALSDDAWHTIQQIGQAA